MSESKLPLVVRLRRTVNAPEIADPEAAAYEALMQSGLAERVKPGDRVAVGCGSRGIAGYALLVRGAIRALRARGAEPFIVPAMGSHGGGTTSGQQEVLAAAGITESSMGVPIAAHMDVVELGTIPGGPAVYFSRVAAAADWVLPINRVKPHTDFHADLASGVVKMLVIGFGKAAGAKAIHTYGVRGLAEFIPHAAAVVLDRVNVLAGLAVVENAHERPAIIRALAPDQLLVEERGLLREARALMGRLPVDHLDVLVLDEMGKDISGTGMDTGVIGRLYIAGQPEYDAPRISRIAVLDLTSASHGNALGVGLADVITARLRRKIDEQVTAFNTVTSTFLERGRIPITLASDREAIEAAVRCSWQPDPAKIRLVRARNTLLLNDLYVSVAVCEELAGQPGIEIVGPPQPWRFTAAGDLAMPW